MKIIADENIPFVNQAFAHLGDVMTLSGRLIHNENLKNANVLLVRSVTEVNRELLKKSKIKFVATATSGINHIDTVYLQENNIGFATALGSNALSVAQYVISAVCLWSLQKQRSLDQLTLGIIGYGNVGRRLKSICDVLGINTVINDPLLAEKTEYPDIKFDGIEKALACDVVSLHVPYTINGKHPTENLINSESLTSINPESLFINSSRGEVVVEDQLLDYSQKNNVNLVLDVWQNEPNISLTSLAQTLIGTPHIAGYSYDGKIRGTEMIYQACCEFFDKPMTWSQQYVDFASHKSKSISYSKDLDIREQILKAYDITKDDLTDKLNRDSIGENFDWLRKNYSIRREWSFI